MEEKDSREKESGTSPGQDGPVRGDGDEANGPPVRGGGSRKRLWLGFLALLLVCAAVFTPLYLCVWRADSRGAREEAYEKSWRGYMEEFDSRLEEEEKKAEGFLAAGDLSSVIILVRERIVYLEGLIEEMLDLTPPPELQRLHVVTLYYLLTEVDQLKARNDLNEAILKENPTEDLTSIAENAVARTQFAFRELSIEMQKVGVMLGEDGGVPEREPETPLVPPADEEPEQQEPPGNGEEE